MKRNSIAGVLIVSLVATGIMTGCETTGQSAGLGAVIGGAAGYAIGGTEGALIGAAVGAGAGFVIHKAKERRVKSAEETATEYKYEPEDGLKADLRPATSASPSTVPQGSSSNAELEYYILGAGDGGTAVHEKQIITQDGTELVTLRDESVSRVDGTWNVSTPIEVDSSVAPGNYDLVQTISVAGNNMSTRTPLTVTTKTAMADSRIIFGEPEPFTVSR